MKTWDRVSGYVYFVRNHAGSEFPFFQTFGITTVDAKKRLREAIARRIEHGRAKLTVVGLARVTLTTDEMLQEFNYENRWQEYTPDE